MRLYDLTVIDSADPGERANQLIAHDIEFDAGQFQDMVKTAAANAEHGPARSVWDWLEIIADELMDNEGFEPAPLVTAVIDTDTIKALREGKNDAHGNRG